MLGDEELLGGSGGGETSTGQKRLPLIGANDLCAVIRVLHLDQAIDGTALPVMLFELVETLTDSILLHSSSSTYSR